MIFGSVFRKVLEHAIAEIIIDMHLAVDLPVVEMVQDLLDLNDGRAGHVEFLGELVEGCTVSTKAGMIKTDHILFIASGAFHLSKPSDLIPELQGRLPIRVELSALTVEDFVRILRERDGIKVARRTITKYRKALGIPASTMRRSY